MSGDDSRGKTDSDSGPDSFEPKLPSPTDTLRAYFLSFMNENF